MAEEGRGEGDGERVPPVFSPKCCQWLSVAPFCLVDVQSSTIEAAVNKFADKEVRWSSQGMLRLSQDAMKRLFATTVDNIHRVIASVLDDPKIQGEQVVGRFPQLETSRLLNRSVEEQISKTHSVQFWSILCMGWTEWVLEI